MTKYVLDASAVLGLLNQEKGHERVEAMLASSVIGAVNFYETIGKLIDGGMPEDEARHSFDLLNLRVIVFDTAMAQRAASLLPMTRKFGLSLGDRSCLALGLSLRHTIVTAERAWAKLQISAPIVVIR